MKYISRWFAVVLLLLAPAAFLHAEKVSTLPAPTGYVNDFAGVLSPSTKQSIEDLCTQVDRQAHAQIAVVTVKTIDDDVSIEEFATKLQEKWGVGAKVSDLGRAMVPAASQGDYNTAIPLGVRQIAQVIARDAGVTLTQPVHQYHRQQVQDRSIHLSFTQLLLGGGAILLLFFLVKTGNLGLIFFLLGNLMGGGGGGYRGEGRDRRDGGGFGGFGGGSSGGGGAS